MAPEARIVPQKPWNPQYFWIPVIAILVVSSLIYARPIVDPDFFWHLETGKLIESEHEIPRTDSFSYTAEGHKWVTHEWLFELIIYQFYKLGSFEAISVFNIAMCLLVIFVPLSMHRVKRIDPIWLLMIGLTGSLIYLTRSEPRPLVLTSFFFGIFILILENNIRKKTWHLWLIVPITLVWANWHSGFIFGLLLVAYYYVCELIRAARNSRDSIKPDHGRIGLVLMVSVLAGMANPNFIDAYMYPIWLGKFYSQVILKIVEISELVNLTPDQIPPFWLSVYLIVAGTAIGFRKLNWRGGLLIIALIALSMYRMRFTELYTPVFLAFAPDIIQTALDRIRLWLKGYRYQILMVPLTAATLLYICFLVSYCQYGPPHIGLSETAFPVESTNWIEEHDPPGNIYNSWNFGSYLAWRFYPERKVFMDGRLDVYEDVFRDILGGKDIIRDFGIDYVMENPTLNRFSTVYTPADWAMVSFDTDCVLLIKRNGAASGLIEGNEIYFLGPGNPIEMFKNIGNVPDEAKNILVQEVVRVTEANRSPAALISGIGAYIMLGEDYYPEARELLDSAMQEYPLLSRFWYLDAVLDFKMGNYEDAEATLRSMLLWWPRSNYAREFLGEVLMLKGDPQRAIRIWNRMVFMKETTADTHFLLASAFHEIGNDGEARRELEQYFTLAGISEPDPESEAGKLRAELGVD